MTTATRPDVLICAGLDPSGGAGFLADASVVRVLGGRPVGVITAQTVQNTQGMRSCHEVDREVFGEQLTALLTDVEIRAVKIGLLGGRAVIDELGAQLALTAAPVVWDPVAAASSGVAALDGALVEVALGVLRPHLTLITPNVSELARLAGAELRDLDDAIAAATRLAGDRGVAVLVKGGHLDGDAAVDVLCRAGEVTRLPGPRHAGADVHGTGCALSTAIAVRLALGDALIDACRAAKAFVAERISNPVRPGRGAPSVV